MFSTYYVPAGGWYRRLSPVTKIVVPVAFVTIGFFMASPLSAVWLLPSVVILLWLARIPGWVVRTFTRVLYTLVPVITVSWLLLFQEGRVLWAWRFLRVTSTGLARAVAMDFRFTAIILSVPLILGAMPQQDLVAGLRKLRVPYMVCFILALALRFIPTLMADSDQIREAQMARGLELEKVSVWRKIGNLVATTLPMLALALARVETLSQVVECRGVTLTRGRDKTFYNEPVLRPVDYVVSLGAVALTLAVGFFRYHCHWFGIGGPA